MRRGDFAVVPSWVPHGAWTTDSHWPGRSTCSSRRGRACSSWRRPPGPPQAGEAGGGRAAGRAGSPAASQAVRRWNWGLARAAGDRHTGGVKGIGKAIAAETDGRGGGRWRSGSRHPDELEAAAVELVKQMPDERRRPRSGRLPCDVTEPGQVTEFRRVGPRAAMGGLDILVNKRRRCQARPVPARWTDDGTGTQTIDTKAALRRFRCTRRGPPAAPAGRARRRGFINNQRRVRALPRTRPSSHRR